MSEVCDICMIDELAYRSKDGEGVVCGGCYKKELTKEQQEEFVKI